MTRLGAVILATSRQGEWRPLRRNSALRARALPIRAATAYSSESRRPGGLVLPDQPGAEPRQPDDGEAHQVQPGTQVGQGRGDQREGLDEVGPGGGDLDADRAAQ